MKCSISHSGLQRLCGCFIRAVLIPCNWPYYRIMIFYFVFFLFLRKESHKHSPVYFLIWLSRSNWCEIALNEWLIVCPHPVSSHWLFYCTGIERDLYQSTDKGQPEPVDTIHKAPTLTKACQTRCFCKQTHSTVLFNIALHGLWAARRYQSTLYEGKQRGCW